MELTPKEREFYCALFNAASEEQQDKMNKPNSCAKDWLPLVRTESDAAELYRAFKEAYADYLPNYVNPFRLIGARNHTAQKALRELHYSIFAFMSTYFPKINIMSTVAQLLYLAQKTRSDQPSTYDKYMHRIKYGYLEVRDSNTQAWCLEPTTLYDRFRHMKVSDFNRGTSEQCGAYGANGAGGASGASWVNSADGTRGVSETSGAGGASGANRPSDVTGTSGGICASSVFGTLPSACDMALNHYEKYHELIDKLANQGIAVDVMGLARLPFAWMGTTKRLIEQEDLQGAEDILRTDRVVIEANQLRKAYEEALARGGEYDVFDRLYIEAHFKFIADPVANSNQKEKYLRELKTSVMEFAAAQKAQFAKRVGTVRGKEGEQEHFCFPEESLFFTKEGSHE